MIRQLQFLESDRVFMFIGLLLNSRNQFACETDSGTNYNYYIEIEKPILARDVLWAGAGTAEGNQSQSLVGCLYYFNF